MLEFFKKVWIEDVKNVKNWESKWEKSNICTNVQNVKENSLGNYELMWIRFSHVYSCIKLTKITDDSRHVQIKNMRVLDIQKTKIDDQNKFCKKRSHSKWL